MPERRYLYDNDSLDRLAANFVTWQAADYVLRYAEPKMRKYLGTAIMQVAGRDQRPAWLMVTCMEQEPDGDAEQWLVISARYLTRDEVAAIITALKE